MKLMTNEQYDNLEERAKFYEHQASMNREDRYQVMKANELRNRIDELNREIGAMKQKQNMTCCSAPTEKKPETVRFDKYCADRLETLKKEFPLKPTKHSLEIEMNDINDLEVKSDDLDYLEGIVYDIKNGLDSEFIRIDGQDYRREQVLRFKMVYGHPEAYTEDEIAKWAGDKLHDEIQSLQVVKPTRYGTIFGSLADVDFARIAEKMTLHMPAFPFPFFGGK